MHVPFRIPYRNRKKDSYPIPRPPSWDDRNCSYGHQLYPSEWRLICVVEDIIKTSYDNTWMDHLIQIIGISFHLVEGLNIQKIHIKSITAWPIDLLHTNDNVCLNLKGILFTKIVIFSYPKLLSFSVLTFMKWRLTPSYAAKDTIFWQKRPKTIVIRIIVLDDNIQIYSYDLLCEPVLNMRTV
jgi:hypothetical protein